MRKIKTLFLKDQNDLSLVTTTVDPDNSWVLQYGNAYRKLDGAACAYFNGVIYVRYDAKLFKGTLQYKKPIPKGAFPCQQPDPITGHHPHWVPADSNNPSHKYFFEGFINTMKNKPIAHGTYELVGPKVNKNPEGYDEHAVVNHNETFIYDFNKIEITYESLRKYLEPLNIEGIVFKHKLTGQMCKIRKSDFGLQR